MTMTWYAGISKRELRYYHPKGAIVVKLKTGGVNVFDSYLDKIEFDRLSNG